MRITVVPGLAGTAGEVEVRDAVALVVELAAAVGLVLLVALVGRAVLAAGVAAGAHGGGLPSLSRKARLAGVS